MVNCSFVLSLLWDHHFVKVTEWLSRCLPRFAKEFHPEKLSRDWGCGGSTVRGPFRKETNLSCAKAKYS